MGLVGGVWFLLGRTHTHRVSIDSTNMACHWLHLAATTGVGGAVTGVGCRDGVGQEFEVLVRLPLQDHAVAVYGGDVLMLMLVGRWLLCVGGRCRQGLSAAPSHPQIRDTNQDAPLVVPVRHVDVHIPHRPLLPQGLSVRGC